MDKDSEGKALTATNLCKQCSREFKTLEDEQDDTCGNCHQENYDKQPKQQYHTALIDNLPRTIVNLSLSN